MAQAMPAVTALVPRLDDTSVHLLSNAVLSHLTHDADSDESFAAAATLPELLPRLPDGMLTAALEVIASVDFGWGQSHLEKDGILPALKKLTLPQRDAAITQVKKELSDISQRKSLVPWIQVGEWLSENASSPDRLALIAAFESGIPNVVDRSLRLRMVAVRNRLRETEDREALWKAPPESRNWETAVEEIDGMTDVRQLEAIADRLQQAFARKQNPPAPEIACDIWKGLLTSEFVRRDLSVNQRVGNGIVAAAPELDSTSRERLRSMLTEACRDESATAPMATVRGFAVIAQDAPPKEIARFLDLVVGRFEREPSHWTYVALERAILADSLKGHLDGALMERIVNACVETLTGRLRYRRDHADNGSELSGLARLTLNLIPSLSRDQRGRLSRAFLVGMQSTFHDPYIEEGIEPIDWMDDELNDHYWFNALSIVLARRSIPVGEAMFRPFDGNPFVLMSNSRTMARLLAHPDCVRGFRSCALERFEELVLYDGASVEFADRISDDSRDDTPHDLSRVNMRPERKFRTVGDAAAWIAKNWPDFDLEAVWSPQE